MQFHRRRNQSPTDNELAAHRKIGYLGLDVYEEEEQIFFEDRSGLILSDDVFARLLTFPNMIITGHQAFFTREALYRGYDNISRFQDNQPLEKLAG